MQNKMLQNDLKRNKLVTLTLVLFIACASLLASLAAALAVNLSDAINALMARAETPHFLQMHSGDIDIEQLSAFASNNSDVDKFQVLRFLNLEGGAIRLGDELLTDSTQDNGLSVQSGRFGREHNTTGGRTAVCTRMLPAGSYCQRGRSG